MRILTFGAAFLLGLSAVLVVTRTDWGRPDRSFQGTTPVLHAPLWQVPEFQLESAEGVMVSLRHLEGKVWIANFMFTRCPGPCPLMTRRLLDVQDALSGHADFNLVSFSVDPGFDTPEVLRAYARSWKTDAERWFFLSADNEVTIDDLARGFRIGVERIGEPEGTGSGEESLAVDSSIIHTTRFLLIDRQGWVRGVLDSEDDELIPKLVPAVEQLLAEPPRD